MDRRSVFKSLAGLAALGAAPSAATGAVIGKHTILDPGLNPESLPQPALTGGLAFLTVAEARTVGAVFDRLIPADELSVGATQAGCVEFLDRQLAGDYGRAATQYRQGPFVKGTPQQGPQFQQTPAERYRAGLAALDAYCAQAQGKAFADLTPDQQDALLTDMEGGKVDLGGTDAKAFFELMLQNVREGYFADPMYGGNKDMAGWKLVGFPGARYDYRDVIGKRGQKLDLPPVSLLDRG
ncbi:MAG: gluconate 2-dehydrogenase subunit 3 family protein [Azospirillaceae bacterium]|nr:gluconate 2-dehydrogenase subunit 3 family protein [Azospirillaceae bacterium]